MAHVMNYQEIQIAALNGSIIYEELRRVDRVRPMKFDGVDFVGTDKKCFLLLMECNEEECPDYNFMYRCWDEPPTDELRSSTPWKDNPYPFLLDEDNA